MQVTGKECKPSAKAAAWFGPAQVASKHHAHWLVHYPHGRTESGDVTCDVCNKPAPGRTFSCIPCSQTHAQQQRTHTHAQMADVM